MIETQIDFISKKKYALFFSIILSMASIILLVTNGLNLGTDFSGGVTIDFSTTTQPNIKILRSAFEKRGYSGVELQNVDANSFILKLSSHSDANTQNDIVADITNTLHELKLAVLLNKVDYIGPKVSSDFTTNSIKAVFFALIAMMIYVWCRFEWQFGIGVVLSLLHDVIMIFGFFSFTRYQFDLTSVAVILTVIGYSINDSIVIYDRIRENLGKTISNLTKTDLSILINKSINETLSRTIMTSLTTLVVCIALLTLGGEVLRSFSAGLVFGIAFGTYSSIYISAPVLMLFCKDMMNNNLT